MTPEQTIREALRLLAQLTETSNLPLAERASIIAKVTDASMALDELTVAA